jgi:hypothetical protein
MTDLMTVDQVLDILYLSRARNKHGNGNEFLISMTQYRQLERSLAHYIQTGEITKGEHGFMKREKK